MKKPGLDPDLSENYRPISNLPFLSKVLERVVFTQIEFHLDAFKLLPSHQSAYRKYHSTETLLARVASDLISDANNGKHTLLAMLDLSAAFDTVNHTILLERLAKSFGISDHALWWFAKYLTERIPVCSFYRENIFFNSGTLWCSAGLCTWALTISLVHRRHRLHSIQI